MSGFVEFARSLGILIDEVPPIGRWCRYPTVTHPRKKNGSVKYLGDIGFAQEHSTMIDVAVWHPERDEVAKIDLDAIRRAAEREMQRLRARWDRTAAEAEALIRRAFPNEHNYLHFKGLGHERGLVLEDGALLVPMRHWRSNRVQGAQLIRWVDDGYEKKMLPGTRAKGAVLCLGSRQAPRSWLVEGYATGLSVLAALRLVRSRDAVVVCFSAGNLAHVAAEMGGNLVVFADHDHSGTGQRMAAATGHPVVMSPNVGEDANDFMAREGVFKLAALMRRVPVT